MAHLPWTRHAGHARGYDEGGVEHLETDVMRFMAILAFCLVAIFALVQSMPMQAPPAPEPVAASAAPEPVMPPAPAPPAAAAPVAPEPAAPEPEPAPVVDPPPAQVAAAEPPVEASPTALVFPPRTPPRQPEPESVALVLPKPAPRPMRAARDPAPVAAAPPRPEPRAAVPEPPPAPPAQVPAPARAAPASAQRGFSLRFDSDAALRELLSRDAVALYALAHGKAWRAMLVGERLSFRPAQVPARFHEMTPETVPDDVATTLRRLVTVSEAHLTWGVTLPAAMSRQLNDYLSAFDHGDLVIGADGQLRLARGGESAS